MPIFPLSLKFSIIIARKRSVRQSHSQLTIARHANSHALAKAAKLAAVATESIDGAFAISQTSVLYLLLNTPPEKTLQATTFSS